MDMRLVKDTMVGKKEGKVMSGLITETKPVKQNGILEGIVRRTMPVPKTTPNVMPAGKAPATRISKTQFGSVQYPGTHS